MDITLLFVAFLLLFGTTGVFFYTKESREYNNIAPNPEDLLRDGADLSIVEYPNIQRKYVKVFGRKFSSKAVFWSVFKDIHQLKKVGYQLSVSYHYDETEPLPKELFSKLLKEYQEKMYLWEGGNQTTPNPKTRPQAPYDYTEKRLCIDSFKRGYLDR